MSTSTPVSDRLRLAPHAVVLRRGVEELQVGVHPAVVVPLRYGGLLDRLAVPGSEADLIADAAAAGVPAADAQALLGALSEAGLLAGPAVGTRTPVLRLVGAGALGRRTASVLAAAGAGIFYLADLPGSAPAARRPDPRGTARAGPEPPDRVAVLAAGLQRRYPGLQVHRARHFAKPEGVEVDLTLLAADGPEVDRLVPDTLLRADSPHLVLRSTGHEVSVGPLVVPGQTSCVRCADLARRDADPQWPWVLAQLTRVRLDPAPALLAWAGACAAAQALAFLSGGAPESVGHTLELSTRDHTMRLRAWPVHSGCGCRWPGGTE